MSNVDYTLPRGKLYFDQFTAGTTVGQGERYFGHTPEINRAIEIEKIDHYNSDEANNPKDKSVILQIDTALKFMCDSIDDDNIALFFMGAVNAVAQTVQAGDTETITGVQQGRYYQLGATSGNPTGIRGTSGTPIVLNSVEVSSTGKTEGDDFTFDGETGRIYIIPGGGIADDDDIDLDYDRPANTRSQIIPGTALIEGSLRYIADNKAGPNRDFFWPYVSIQADGDLNLKGAEWQKIGFNAEVLKLGTQSVVYIDGRPA